MTVPYRITAALASSLALAAGAFAQTAPAAPKKEEAVELSPFEVSAKATRGYVASESMTGSRVATEIKDLPFTVNVLTSEFFEDFALFELNDNVAYIGSFTGLDQGGGFNLRGFNATNQLRDGFFRLGRYGSSNVDRIEVIKGPNAALYGQTSPGGMLNMISKKPKKDPYQKLSINIGDYNTNRETFEASGPLGIWGDSSYLTTLGYYNREFETPMSELTNSEAYVALQHDFKNHGSLLLQFEYFLREVDSPTSAAPYILDDKNTSTANDDQIVGIAKNLGTVQQFGPNSELNRGMIFLTSTYEKTFNPVWSTRVSGNYYEARRWDFNQNVAGNTVNQRTLILQRGATPNKGIIFEDGGGVQADLLAHYWFGDRAIENRTLMTFDYNVYYRYDPNWNIAGSALAAWTPIRNITVTPDLSAAVQPIQYLPTWFSWDPGQYTNGRKNKNRTTDIGTLLRHQMSVMDGKVLIYGGARFDEVHYNLRDLAANRQSQFQFNQIEPNLGANIAVNKNLRIYANYSESFFPNQQFITAASITPGYQSEEAQGYDYGFKGSYLDDRLNFTVSGFRIERQNVVVQELDTTTGTLVNVPEGDQLVQGFEIDLNWRITDDLTLGGSYGYVDSKITDFGTKTMSVGRSAARVSPQNGGVYLKWDVNNGSFKGFSANVGVTYVAETPTDAPDAGDTYSTTGVYQRTTNQWDQHVPAVTVWNLGVRYSLNSGSSMRLKHTFGINVNNVADKFYLTPTRQVGDRRAIYFNYTLTH